jgi:hypothetical protein
MNAMPPVNPPPGDRENRRVSLAATLFVISVILAVAVVVYSIAVSAGNSPASTEASHSTGSSR